MAGTLTIAARPSPLSRAQVQEVIPYIQAQCPGQTIEFVWLETPGDRDRTTPLSDPSVPDDFFTRDLDQILLDGGADLAVHSAKDLPRRLRAGLSVAAITPCLDPRDAVVLRPGLTSDDDVRVVGSSTPRRDGAVRARWPNAIPKPIRGNIEQRLEQLDRGEFDAVVVAACALKRLGLEHRIHCYLPGDAAPLQGHLALVVRSENRTLWEALRPLDFRLTLPEELLSNATRPTEVTPDTILVTGTHPEHFRDRLGAVAAWPMIRLKARPLNERCAALKDLLPTCDAVVFASAFAAETFAHAWAHWAGARTARPAWLAMGPATADRLERLGLAPDHMVHDFSGIAGFAKSLPSGAVHRCLYPCSSRAPVDERRALLKSQGVALVPTVFYETLDYSPGPLPNVPFRGVLFTSPSTVHSYFRFYPNERLQSRRWIAIGPSTQAALRAYGITGELLDEPS